MQVNPLLSNLTQIPPSSAPVSGVVNNSQSSPVATQTNAAVTNVSQSTQGSATQQDASQKPKIDAKALDSAVAHLNDTAQLFNTQLQFTVDTTTGRQVVKVTDSGTNQVIRQIPSEEVLRLSKALDDFKGLLVKDKA